MTWRFLPLWLVLMLAPLVSSCVDHETRTVIAARATAGVVTGGQAAAHGPLALLQRRAKQGGRGPALVSGSTTRHRFFFGSLVGDDASDDVMDAAPPDDGSDDSDSDGLEPLSVRDADGLARQACEHRRLLETSVRGRPSLEHRAQLWRPPVSIG